ncbi:peroxide stress protein YaaA [Campylobacter sp. MIT 21-1685]|uniref:YaaA family protein n=1 Tax=unclassified Campylobacter TaxID=2593542 RepID=UPI00224AA0DD|nr:MULTISPECIES: peroxide stress protein YaaA [unclassified Campylobacter]MCX2683110.1 peroxide stress protein YaaA [Campylobacter sp. MIT 21-1684]MCX2751430.1 peroxide stress protein YaaA [Campylobacter sp. MIT 21-1682]MCX2807630.1 peroxide stress protein YaaA [Campylobacter sp. MIT 21-1685]
MKILFSPSENKNIIKSGKTLCKENFLFENLFSLRMQVLQEYENFIKTANTQELETLFGLKDEKERQKFTTKLRKAPTQRAIELYNGISYEYLQFNSLEKMSQDYILQNVLIFSNLFGVVRASDMLPCYKLKQGVKLGNFSIEKFYKNHFSKALDEFLMNEELIDLRAGFYNKFYTPKKHFSSYKFIKNGKTVSHFSKAYRGVLLKTAAHFNITSNKELLSHLPANLRLKTIQNFGLKEEYIIEILN